MKYTQPKGTFDIIPQELKEANAWKTSDRWNYLESVIRQLVYDYGYQEIRTPIFEQTDLFIRGVGETSDIVSKEMYSFTDKGQRSMSLRPEGTASVMRAFVQNNLQQLGTLHKFFYIGPFFRYDRPQAGRYRQFHQFGAEAIGDGSPEQDFEIIALLFELYSRLKLTHLKVLINTLGEASSRLKYKEALLAFLKPHFSTLSADSQTRFSKNPLRILDSKDPKERALLENAPSILDFLTPHSRQHFDAVCNLLTEQGIPFEIDPKLVRGLDYYNHTVFEITSNILGAQNTIGAGGRYDGLLPSIGGPDLPCIGFSTGMERILQTMEGQQVSLPPPKGPCVTLISLGSSTQHTAFKLLYKLRNQGISTHYISGKNLPKALQAASQNHSIFAAIIGEEELQKRVVQVKTLSTRETQDVPFEILIEHFKKEHHDGL